MQESKRSQPRPGGTVLDNQSSLEKAYWGKNRGGSPSQEGGPSPAKHGWRLDQHGWTEALNPSGVLNGLGGCLKVLMPGPLPQTASFSPPAEKPRHQCVFQGPQMTLMLSEDWDPAMQPEKPTVGEAVPPRLLNTLSEH